MKLDHQNRFLYSNNYFKATYYEFPYHLLIKLNNLLKTTNTLLQVTIICNKTINKQPARKHGRIDFSAQS